MTTYADDPSLAPQADIPDGATLPQPGPMQEMGLTGLKRVSGYVEEEFLPALRGRNAVKVFREMGMNDSAAGALLFVIETLISETKWSVTPASQDPEDLAAAEFLESCMDDMNQPWSAFITEACSMFQFGYSWHEIVYKKRVGPWETDPTKRSMYTDGLIGWRKLPIRAQETNWRWIFDESGGIQGFVQMAPPTYKQVTIPIERSLLFRTRSNKGDPEGFSLLRRAYRSWHILKRIQEIQAVGMERDLAGMPTGKLPASYLNARQGTMQAATRDSFRKMVRGVRRDENEGILIPSDTDEKGNPLFAFELMNSGGSRQFDIEATIQRLQGEIMRTVMADFLILGTSGQSSTGSYAMHTDKTGLFRTAINSFAKSMADTLNRYGVPRLFALNGWKPDQLPKFEVANIDPPDLEQLASLISSTAGAGMTWFPNPTLEKFILDIAGLPEMPDDFQEHQEQMFEMSQMAAEADSQMQLLGLKQQAEAAAAGVPVPQAQQGMTPEDHAAQQAQTQMGVVQQQQGIAAQQQQIDNPPKNGEDPTVAGKVKLQQTQHGHAKAIGDEKVKQAKLGTEKAKLALKQAATKPPPGRGNLKPKATKKTTPGKKS